MHARSLVREGEKEEGRGGERETSRHRDSNDKLTAEDREIISPSPALEGGLAPTRVSTYAIKLRDFFFSYSDV